MEKKKQLENEVEPGGTRTRHHIHLSVSCYVTGKILTFNQNKPSRFEILSLMGKGKRPKFSFIYNLRSDVVVFFGEPKKQNA